MKLKEYGSELIEVADDGSGVAIADLEGLALKHHTSKLSHIDDFQVGMRFMSKVLAMPYPIYLAQNGTSLALWLADPGQLRLQRRGPQLPVCRVRAHCHHPHSRGYSG